jgi:hypothetical protein
MNAPAIRESWRKLQCAFAALLHALADSIESRVELAIAKQKLKDAEP